MKNKRLKISNRLSYTLIVLGTLILLGVGVYAATAGGGILGEINPNPGHPITELGRPSTCSEGQALVWTGESAGGKNVWSCSDIPSGSSTSQGIDSCSDCDSRFLGSMFHATHSSGASGDDFEDLQSPTGLEDGWYFVDVTGSIPYGCAGDLSGHLEVTFKDNSISTSGVSGYSDTQVIDIPNYPDGDAPFSISDFVKISGKSSMVIVRLNYIGWDGDSTACGGDNGKISTMTGYRVAPVSKNLNRVSLEDW